MERETMRKIRLAARECKIPAKFTPAQVNAALGITWASTFLWKHRVGNKTGDTERFIWLSKGLYRLKP